MSVIPSIAGVVALSAVGYLGWAAWVIWKGNQPPPKPKDKNP